jgi:hypothetical protein
MTKAISVDEFNTFLDSMEALDTGVEISPPKKLMSKKEWDTVCGDHVTMGADRVGVWLVDSLKIRIPIDKVTIHHGGLGEVVQKSNKLTGEFLGEALETSIRSDLDGVRTAFSVVKESMDGKRIGTFLTILINAKMLGRGYFDGITMETIRTIYDYIMGLSAVSFTYEDFMDGECVDIDVRKDFQCEDLPMVNVFQRLKANFKGGGKIDTGFIPFYTGKRWTGLQFNKRTTTSFLTAPFMKIYNKHADSMDPKHFEFFKHHHIKVPYDLWRVEYTIKNKKHLRHIGMGNRLCDVLSTSQNVLNSGMEQITNALFNPRQRTCEALENLDISPRDKMMVNALATIADCGKSRDYAKKQILGGLTGSNRTKSTKYLDGLFDSYLRPIERFNAYEQTDKIFDVIGYRF